MVIYWRGEVKKAARVGGEEAGEGEVEGLEGGFRGLRWDRDRNRD